MAPQDLRRILTGPRVGKQAEQEPENPRLRFFWLVAAIIHALQKPNNLYNINVRIHPSFRVFGFDDRVTQAVSEYRVTGLELVGFRSGDGVCAD